jgi:hypothetical protein
MAHFAQIDENNTVVKVIVIPNEVEDRGEDYIVNELGLEGRWLKTSYNTLANKHLLGGKPFRKNFAAICFTYDELFDAFIPPCPSDKWKLDYTTYRWVPPIPEPEYVDGHVWRWSEVNQEWVSIPFETK